MTFGEFILVVGAIATGVLLPPLDRTLVGKVAINIPEQQLHIVELPQSMFNNSTYIQCTGTYNVKQNDIVTINVRDWKFLNSINVVDNRFDCKDMNIAFNVEEDEDVN